MKINHKKSMYTVYTQGQRWAARVLVIVSLLTSCSPQSALAGQRQGGTVLSTIKFLFVGVLGLSSIGVNSFKSQNQPEVPPEEGPQATIDATVGNATCRGLVPMMPSDLESCQQQLKDAGAEVFWDEINDFWSRYNASSQAPEILSFNFALLDDNTTESHNVLFKVIISCLKGLELPIFSRLVMFGGQFDGKVLQSIAELPIQSLGLYYNGLSSIDGLSSGPKISKSPLAKTLRKLDLAYNQLSDLDISGLPNLEVLELGSNKLSKNSKGFVASLGNLGKLIHLNIAANNFTVLPDPIQDLLLQPQLQVIQLYNNAVCSNLDSFLGSDIKADPELRAKITC